MKIQNNSICSFADTGFVSDANQREITKHGTEEFPCTCYLDIYSNSSYPWHWHEELELAYVKKGSLSVTVNGQQYILNKGEGIFINSGVLHAFTETQNVKCIFPNILFRASLIYSTQTSIYWMKYMRSLIGDVNLPYILLNRDMPWMEEVLNLIKKAYELFASKKFGYELRMRNYLSEILCLILENCPAQTSDLKTRNYTEIDRLRKMLDYVHNNYTEPIQIQQISEAASVSKRECLRCFHHIVGISPRQYVIDLRVRKAKQLLAESSLSLVEICGNCGFHDQSYFTKTFREATGLSPGKWRKEGTHI
jgi:AraC-like DNA-binding protein